MTQNTQLSALGGHVPNYVEIVQLLGNIPARAAAWQMKRLSASRTGEFPIILHQPIDALLNLMSALRTLDREGQIVNQAYHLVLPNDGSIAPGHRSVTVNKSRFVFGSSRALNQFNRTCGSVVPEQATTYRICGKADGIVVGRRTIGH
jgi:hypothetical protein